MARSKALQALPTQAEAPETRATAAHKGLGAATALVLDGVPPDEGGRVLVFGASGKGKTHFGLRLVREVQRTGRCKTAVVLDLKDPERPQYQGKLVHSIQEAQRTLVEEQPPFLVCRSGIAPADAAELVQQAAEAGERIAFFADEMTPLLRINDDTGEPMNRTFCSPSLVWLELQGRGLGAWSFKLCNLPQQVPTSAMDNANAYVVFGTGGRSLEYLQEMRVIPRQAAAVVSRLERGQCCVFFTDREWDGIVYGPED